VRRREFIEKFNFVFYIVSDGNLNKKIGVGMRILKGRYVDGVVRIEGRVDIEGEREVYVVFPDVEVRGIKAGELLKICGIIDVGGDAVKDSEDVYSE